VFLDYPFLRVKALLHFNNEFSSQTQCHIAVYIPVVPTEEAEAEGSLEPKNSRLAWATRRDPCLKKKCQAWWFKPVVLTIREDHGQKI
jgi:hypothetical protein